MRHDLGHTIAILILHSNNNMIDEHRLLLSWHGFCVVPWVVAGRVVGGACVVWVIHSHTFIGVVVFCVGGDGVRCTEVLAVNTVGVYEYQWYLNNNTNLNFNKNPEAAVFSCRLCFLRAFPFISLNKTSQDVYFKRKTTNV